MFRNVYLLWEFTAFLSFARVDVMDLSVQYVTVAASITLLLLFLGSELLGLIFTCFFAGNQFISDWSNNFQIASG